MKLTITVPAYDDHRLGQPLAAVVRPEGLSYATWKGSPQTGGTLTFQADIGDVIRRWQPNFLEGTEGTKYFLVGPGGALLSLTEEEARKKIHNPT